MTGLCLDCAQPSHFGTRCHDGFPLLLLDPVDDAAECVSCGWGYRVTELCMLCRCEAPEPVRLARYVVMPVLDELYWRRVNHETLGGGVCKAVPATHSSGAERVTKPACSNATAAGAGPREPASTTKPLDALGIYALVCIVGGLAGWS